MQHHGVMAGEPKKTASEELASERGGTKRAVIHAAASSPAWWAAGNSLGFLLASMSGATSPLAWGVGAAALFALAAKLGYVPGPERRARADLCRRLRFLDHLYYRGRVRDHEHEGLRKRCLEEFERTLGPRE